MKDIENILLKLYELNERYHDTKEKMAWLGSSLYFAFSLAILRILFIKGMQNIIKQYSWVPWVIIGFLLAAIYCCACWFINLQYKKKRISVGISNEFMDIVSNNKPENKLKKMIKYTRYINDKWGAYKKDHKKECKNFSYTELPINILMGLFFAFQITLIILIRYKFKC